MLNSANSLRTSEPTLLEKLVTFLVAVIPATLLQVFTLMGFFMGIGALMDGEPALLLLMLWSAGGIFGALALWGILFNSRSAWVGFGLISGFLAILPLSVATVIDGLTPLRIDELVPLVWAVGLPVSAIYWLFRIDWAAPEDEPPLLLEYRPNDGHSDWPTLHER